MNSRAVHQGVHFERCWMSRHAFTVAAIAVDRERISSSWPLGHGVVYCNREMTRLCAAVPCKSRYTSQPASLAHVLASLDASLTVSFTVDRMIWPRWHYYRITIFDKHRTSFAARLYRTTPQERFSLVPKRTRCNQSEWKTFSFRRAHPSIQRTPFAICSKKRLNVY